MGVARVVSSAGNYALKMRAGRRFARRGIGPEDRASRESYRPTQRCSANLPRGIAFLPTRLRAVKLPRAILIVNPIASAKDTLACDSCNVWRVIENPRFAFHVLVTGMFRAV